MLGKRVWKKKHWYWVWLKMGTLGLEVMMEEGLGVVREEGIHFGGEGVGGGFFCCCC